jgi:phospholipase C
MTIAGRNTMPIQHVVVLMLENRSFDGMLGMLYASGDDFDGLTGTERNIWHRPNGSTVDMPVWKAPALSPEMLCIPDPDPGELFPDIHMQIHGLVPDPTRGPTMGGFVDNYMRQPPAAAAPAPDPQAVMHYFTPDQVPVISQLARQFGVSDRWHASAPCQTWPNRFFAHAGTAGGYVNNEPARLHTMPTVFNRLDAVQRSWRIYFHDIPQAAALTALWQDVFTHFRPFEDFLHDAAHGALPAYSFIEPRYFADIAGGGIPNDQHPPHNVAEGEALIAAMYNAVRAGPGWKDTLLIITHDEHGGCFDHVPPPPATPPGGPAPDGFAFDYFGVRVPAVIVSPYIRPGSIIRPAGLTPFDHTSIIATLRRLFAIGPLTPRDAAAPDLLGALGPQPDNDGPVSITAPAIPPSSAQVASVAARPPNDLQRSLSSVATLLPTAGADVASHVARVGATTSLAPVHATTADAAGEIAAHMRAFLGPSPATTP